MTVHQSLLPPGWPRPKGYANAIAASGRMIFTAGIVGWDEQQRFADGGLTGQFRQLLLNLLAVLHAGGAGPEHLVRLTWYVVDRDEYVAHLPAIGAIYRELVGKHYPAMAVVQVGALVEPAALIEIEATAVVPEDRL
jgi:enamine deaminase RidA (YjgF/YER057c/UK114 family)